MKISKILHVVSAIAGFCGILSLVGAWCASKNGTTLLNMNETHLFMDAIVLVLIAIWLQIATIHHMMLEKRGEII